MTILMVFSCFSYISFGKKNFFASAISTDYPVTLMNLASKDNSTVLTEGGTSDGSAVQMSKLGKDLSPSWRMDRVGSDSNGTFFKITNAQSGRDLTPKSYNVSNGNSVIVYGDESNKSQHWYAIPVSKDSLGNDLYYKIVNYSNTKLALTQGKSGCTLSNYTGADNQLFLLNPDGLQGFAGYTKNNGANKIKAADIGGLFGETVEVSTFADLKKYATSDTPYTIVVTKNISVSNLEKDSSGNHYYCPDGRINVHSNKTIIGSYGANTLTNVQFLTSTNSGTGNNVIYKNFNLQHSDRSNGNDSIVVYFRSGENLWVDHCTFVGHSEYNKYGYSTSPDWDKFLACCYDADYCTVSDCSFGLHEYGVILGYPDSSASNYSKYDGYPHMTLAANKFDKTLTRAPGLMRWGYYHSLDNYINNFSMAYTIQANARIFAENCRYENGGNVTCDWNSNSGDYASGTFADSGCTADSTCKRVHLGDNATSNNPSLAKAGTWKPLTNYDYISISSTDAKTYTSSYSGAQKDKNNWMYLRYSSKGVPAATYTEAPKEEVITAATLKEGAFYTIKNVNSGLYMEVEGGSAKNNANIQQWGADSAANHNTWRAISAGGGYYYLQSQVGDKTYVLDIAGRKADNGTNVDLYSYRATDNQQFMFTLNSDGSYKIRTKVSQNKSAVEVKDANTSSGANVQEWEVNGANCQDWILTEVSASGEKMDTSKLYMFQNLNSSYYMEIKDGSATAGANAQQWEANGSGENKSGDWNTFNLKQFNNGDLYYINSQLAGGEAFCLRSTSKDNGGNIELAAYSKSDSSMLFKFVKNPDGTYYILPHTMSDNGAVEITNASTDIGANVGQWAINGNNCQKWNLVSFAKPVVTTTTAAPIVTTTKAPTTTTVITTTKTVTTTKAPIITTTATPIITTTKAETTTTAEPIITTTTTKIEPTSETVVENILLGDTNKDGMVSIADAVLLNRYIAGSVDLDDVAIKNSDLYQIEGQTKIEIDSNDVETLLSYLVNNIQKIELPIKVSK